MRRGRAPLLRKCRGGTFGKRLSNGSLDTPPPNPRGSRKPARQQCAATSLEEYGRFFDLDDGQHGKSKSRQSQEADQTKPRVGPRPARVMLMWYLLRRGLKRRRPAPRQDEASKDIPRTDRIAACAPHVLHEPAGSRCQSWLSLSALFVCGAIDGISICMKHNLQRHQLIEPDLMKPLALVGPCHAFRKPRRVNHEPGMLPLP